MMPWRKVGNMGEDANNQFFPPIVIVNVNHKMKLMQEEVVLYLVFPLIFFLLIHQFKSDSDYFLESF